MCVTKSPAVEAHSLLGAQDCDYLAGPIARVPGSTGWMLLQSMVHHQMSSLQRHAHGLTFLQRTDPRKTRRHTCGEKLASKHANPLHKGSPRSSLSVYHNRHRAGKTPKEHNGLQSYHSIQGVAMALRDTATPNPLSFSFLNQVWYLAS